MFAGSCPSSISYLTRRGIRANTVRLSRQTLHQMNGINHDNAVHKDIHKVLYTKEQISAKALEVGRIISEHYADKRPLLLGALNGAFIFMADLARSIEPVPDGMDLDFIRASSYTGTSTTTSGEVSITSLRKVEVEGRHVLLVEDIIDTGATASNIRDTLLELGAADVKLVALLDKKARRTCDIHPDYCCFLCPDEFVVGYRLDYNEQYRTLPYVGVLKPALYQ